MRLFDFERAPNPRRLRIFLAEKGLVIPRVPVNLYRMEQLSPEFLAINPGGTVPVLETDDGEYLAEGLAIALYLESLYPDPPRLGASPAARARAVMWTRIVEDELLGGVAEVLRNLSPGFRDRALPGPADQPQVPALIQRGARRVAQALDRMDARLSGSEWLAGPDYSFADASLLAAADFAGWVDIDATAGRPALARWYARASARPSGAA